MKLYVIRHGETVDNVKGLYAGTSDSQLTNHGVEQARLLGQYLAETNVKFSHVFASPLSRAVKTADAIRRQQNVDGLEIIKVQELIERDYGAYEGKPYASKAEWQKTGKDGLELENSVESTDSLAKRADTFLDEQLLPLFDQNDGDKEYVVAIVAHGMLNSHLWRRLLLRLPKKSLKIAPEITAARGEVVLERLGGWSNTGYLELSIWKDEHDEPEHTVARNPDIPKTATLPTPVPPPLQSEGADVSVAPPQKDEPEPPKDTDRRLLSGYSTNVLAIDSRQHLIGLRRQGGGIGSSAHDEGQKKLDGFFKRQKLS